MPIPPFSIDGVLPPYVGPSGPGGAPEDLSPYSATPLEVVTALGHTDERRVILGNWLRHRAELRTIGFDRGFQWLDGSFVEQKTPKDLDVVTFLYRPVGIVAANQLALLMRANLNLFGRAQVKTTFNLDFFGVDLDGSPEALVNVTRYWLGLFSHRRGDDLWKGMIQVRLEDPAEDSLAQAALASVLPAGPSVP